MLFEYDSYHKMIEVGEILMIKKLEMAVLVYFETFKHYGPIVQCKCLILSNKFQ